MNENGNASSPGGAFGTKAIVATILVTAIATGGGTWLLTRRGAPAHDHGAAAEAKEQWQCPMHPGIVEDHPGDCPICGMKLVKISGPGGATSAPAGAEARPAHEVLFYRSPMDPKVTSPTPRKDEMGMDYLPVYADEVGDAPPVEGLSEVGIDPARQQLIGLKIARAERGPVGGSWRTSGRMAVDETRVHHVNVKFSGFMERVYADFVGKPVRKGAPLFSIYSPELLAAQQEYLLALDTRRKLSASGGLSADGDALVSAARRKLELWDVPRAEIDRIARSGEASRTLTFYAPASGVVTRKDVVPGMRVNAGDMPFEIVDLSHVWFLADAYESDLGQVNVGMHASITLKAFPNRAFRGRVAFIDPILDAKTRTAKVRIDVANPSGALRPEMFGEAVLQEGGRRGTRIPADAVIQSGTRSVVFVALGDGRFQPREVQLGQTGPDYVEIVSGLAPGDGVVTRANFLVDSESRLRASLAALSSGAPASSGHAEGRTPPAREAPARPGGAEASADPHAGHGG